MDTNKLPLSTISGALVILLFCIFTLASAARYPPPFSPVDNWLSDLGTAAKNPLGYVYFDTGCILTGVSMLFFVSGMSTWLEKNKASLTAGRILGALSAFTLMLIGVFDENTPYHLILSITFFLFLLLFMASMNISLWKHPAYKRWVGYYALIAIAVNVIFGFTFFTSGKSIVLEWLSVFSALAWAGLLSYNMARPGLKPQPEAIIVPGPIHAEDRHG